MDYDEDQEYLSDDVLGADDGYGGGRGIPLGAVESTSNGYYDDEAPVYRSFCMAQAQAQPQPVYRSLSAMSSLDIGAVQSDSASWADSKMQTQCYKPQAQAQAKSRQPINCQPYEPSVRTTIAAEPELLCKFYFLAPTHVFSKPGLPFDIVIGGVKSSLNLPGVDAIWRPSKETAFRFECVVHEPSEVNFGVRVFTRAKQEQQQGKYVIEVAKMSGCGVTFMKTYRELVGGLSSVAQCGLQDVWRLPRSPLPMPTLRSSNCQPHFMPSLKDGSSSSRQALPMPSLTGSILRMPSLKGSSTAGSGGAGGSTVGGVTGGGGEGNIGSVCQGRFSLPRPMLTASNICGTLQPLISMAQSKYIDIQRNAVQSISKLTKDVNNAQLVLREEADSPASESMVSQICKCTEAYDEKVRRDAVASVGNLAQGLEKETMERGAKRKDETRTDEIEVTEGTSRGNDFDAHQHRADVDSPTSRKKRKQLHQVEAKLVGTVAPIMRMLVASTSIASVEMHQQCMRALFNVYKASTKGVEVFHGTTLSGRRSVKTSKTEHKSGDSWRQKERDDALWAAECKDSMSKNERANLKQTAEVEADPYHDVRQLLLKKVRECELLRNVSCAAATRKAESVKGMANEMVSNLP